MKKIYMGFNTSGNNQTSGRTTSAVSLGKLRNTSGSITRIFKYCNKNSPDLAQTFRCVFDISDISSKYISDIDISGKYQIAVGSYAFAISKDYGFTWEQKPEFESYNLRSVAISNDGKYILVGGVNTPLFYSNDGGGSFIQKFTLYNWFEIKMSKSGQYQTAIGPTNEIYISNNYGETFTIHNTSGNVNLNSGSNYLAMSYDGKYQSITINTGIYRSNDYGQTWNVIDLSSISNPPSNLQGMGMSGNGKIQMAVDINLGNVYKSTDYGVTWTYIYNIPDNLELFFISLSETGQYVLIPDYSGYIWTSNDYGNTFTNNLKIDDQSQLTFGTTGWYPCSISNTGQYQTVCDYDGPLGTAGYIYTSNDYGKNFYIRNSSGEKNWWGCCMN
jgi:photosystem II stability/assembly factor-like uncharacterized protein